MAQKGDLMTARSDIRVLDATIRDGGLVNNFMFSDDFINALYRTNVKAGVDYMEFGYKASKELFDVNAFGKWKFCDEEDIRAIVGENDTPLKLRQMPCVLHNTLTNWLSTDLPEDCMFGEAPVDLSSLPPIGFVTLDEELAPLC